MTHLHQHTGGAGKTQVEIADGVMSIMICNPPTNAITLAMFAELGEAVTAAQTDNSVRVIVIRGAGEHLYTVGQDIAEMDEHSATDRRTTTSRWPARVNAVLDIIDASQLPIVCSMKGYSYGAGLEIAAACDIRIAAPTTRIAMPEVKLGIIPGYGGTQRLSRLMGTAHTMALVLSAREIDVDRALAWGLVDFVVDDPDAEAAVLGKAITGYGPHAVRNAKAAIRAASVLPLDEGLQHERALFIECAESTDFDERRTAFLMRGRSDRRRTAAAV